MKRSDRPAERRASGKLDPLDEALRQIGADLLEEPVPERLRALLRSHAESREPAQGSARGGRTRKDDR